METALASLPRDGRLRAAINLGNRALAREVDGELRGVSPALARRLAKEIGATLEPVVYHGAGRVFDDADRDAWDVGFLAIDRLRAEKVAFTRPYVTIEASFAVRADSAIQDVAEADRAAHLVLVSAGSAYDMYLTDTLRHARIERGETPSASFDMFRSGSGDLVAGVRQSLERAFAGDAAIRILPGAFKTIEQAMVLPRRDDPRLGPLDDCVARAISDGFVAAELG